LRERPIPAISEGVQFSVPLAEWLVLPIAMASAAGCSPASEPARTAREAPPTATPRAIEPGSPRAGPSVFDEPDTWTDETGRPVVFAQWRGRPLVLTAFFTQCRATCPRTIARLRTIYDAARGGTPAPEFVLVTLDPERDTPDRLRRFKAESGLPASWHLVVGSVDATRAILDLLDVHVLASDAHIVHDGRIAVFDPQGRLAHRYGGWGIDEETSSF
jgi:protein SCO1/2